MKAAAFAGLLGVVSLVTVNVARADDYVGTLDVTDRTEYRIGYYGYPPIRRATSKRSRRSILSRARVGPGISWSMRRG